jgi:hypothetical protein
VGLVIAGQDDSVVDQLSFKLPSTSSFSTERRLVSAYPSGASLFSPDRVRVASFTLTSSEGWLNPSTLRLAFKLKNTSATDTLQLASGPWCLFNQLRLLFGGVEVERIDLYGRQHELMRHLLMPSAWNLESSVEVLGADINVFRRQVFWAATPSRGNPSRILCKSFINLPQVLCKAVLIFFWYLPSSSQIFRFFMPPPNGRKHIILTSAFPHVSGSRQRKHHGYSCLGHCLPTTKVCRLIAWSSLQTCLYALKEPVGPLRTYAFRKLLGLFIACRLFPAGSQIAYRRLNTLRTLDDQGPEASARCCLEIFWGLRPPE